VSVTARQASASATILIHISEMDVNIQNVQMTVHRTAPATPRPVPATAKHAQTVSLRSRVRTAPFALARMIATRMESVSMEYASVTRDLPAILVTSSNARTIAAEMDSALP